MTSRDPTDEREALSSALAGHYEIEHEIGRGGMATVYLARDTRHDRRVAVKVLNRDLGVVLGVERFLSEIRVTANLQHPNVLPLFDSGEADGLLYYVMPFVDGETLRAKLAREKQLPVDEALRIAVAIANAAEYAHAHGVVHRDLKPENILLQSGQPIVADFGIALAVSNAGGARVTQTGMSLGTPSYMSPEQATGDRQIDARSDVYAIGAMTYEMLVGEPPHTGSTSQAIIARVLTDRPRPVRESRASVPEHVDEAIARALEKLPADRFTTAREFAEALEGRGATVTGQSARRSRARSSRIASTAAVVLGVSTVAAGFGWWRSAHRPSPSATRFTVLPPTGSSITGGGALKIGLSRDGQSLAFAGSGTRLFIRHLDQLQPVLFPNGVPAGPEFRFSDDGKWLAYWNGGPNIIRIGPGDVGAQPTRLVDLKTIGNIAAFSSDLVYLFDNEFWSVPAAGGSPRKLASMDTTLDASWTRPILLPDGKTLAFSATPRGAQAAPARIALVSIDGGPRMLLGLEGNGVVGYVDGILVFTRGGGKLMAVRFDVRRREVQSTPADVLPDRFIGPSGVTMSDNGTLAYLAPDVSAAKVKILDELGNVTSVLPEVRRYIGTTVSPDGKRIAVVIAATNQVDIWVYNVESRQLTRLTQTGIQFVSWSADSKRIAFNGDAGISWMSVDGNSAPEPIPGTSGLARGLGAMALSPDGKYLVVLRQGQPGQPWGTAVPLAGGAPLAILQGANAPQAFAVSPNGKWIAYESRESGSHEIYVRPFPTGAGQVQVSSDGGDAPQWSPDGRKIIYRKDDEFHQVMLDIGGTMPRVVRSEVLFPNRDVTDRPLGSLSVHPDGKHFVVTQPQGDPTTLVVVTNWLTEVRAKLAGK